MVAVGKYNVCFWHFQYLSLYVFDIFSIYHFIKFWVSLVLLLITDDVIEFYKTPVDKTARLDSLKSIKSCSDSIPPLSVAMFMECQLRHIIIFCLYFYKGYNLSTHWHLFSTSTLKILHRSVTFVSNPFQFVNRAWPSKWLKLSWSECHS
jgi:hypothetical protein